jgi:asparagine N-glycosylation enzyme membrane subunit Stt3
MLMTLAVILFVLWLLGFVAFHVSGGLIHLVLVVAAVIFLYDLFVGRRSRV